MWSPAQSSVSPTPQPDPAPGGAPLMDTGAAGCHGGAALPWDTGNVSLQELAPARTFPRSINIHRERCRHSLGPRERHYPVSVDPPEPFFDKIHGRCIHSSEALRGAAGLSAEARRPGRQSLPLPRRRSWVRDRWSTLDTLTASFTWFLLKLFMPRFLPRTRPSLGSLLPRAASQSRFIGIFTQSFSVKMLSR